MSSNKASLQSKLRRAKAAADEAVTKKLDKKGPAVKAPAVRRTKKVAVVEEDEVDDEEEGDEEAPKKKGETRMEQAHKINELIEQGPISVARICEKLGYSEARVKNHVEFYMGRKEGAPGRLIEKKGKGGKVLVVLEGEAARRRGQKVEGDDSEE